MDVPDNSARRDALDRLSELVSIGREYETFARDRPSQADAQIAALNAPGLQAAAWDLMWVPDTLRARIARVSSIVVLDLTGASGDQGENLLDALMPTAILTACVVAATYGVRNPIPRDALPGRLGVFAALLRRVLDEEPETLAARARAEGLPSVPLPPIVSCLPSRIRDRLLGLAHVLAPRADPLRVKLVTTIFVIGAVATERFEPLQLDSSVS